MSYISILNENAFDAGVVNFSTLNPDHLVFCDVNYNLKSALIGPHLNFDGTTLTVSGFEPSITAGTTAKYYRGDKSWVTLDSSVVPENTNLYFTNARAVTACSATYEPIITAGTASQYIKGNKTLGTLDTLAVAENTNLYFTNARAITACSGTYEPVISTGTTSQYIRGNKSLATLDTLAVPENTNLYFTNARAVTACSGTYEPVITVGTAAQYWTGEKKFATLNTLAVAENTNLYFTNARAVTACSGTYEPVITAGTASQYIKGNKTLGTLDTLAVTENTNLYFTNARAVTACSGTYEPVISTGTAAQYIKGNKTLGTLDTLAVPENTNLYFTNARAVTACSGTYEPVITAGTTAKYWRGDKSWVTLDSLAVPENTNLYFTNARAISACSATYEPIITAGTSSQYIKGDKTLGTLNQAAVAGLTTGSSPTFTGLTVSGLTASKIVFTDTGGLLKTVSIGANLTYDGTTLASSATVGVSAIIGTANQVLANGTSGSSQTGSITLTLPQSINTTSSPTFADLTVSGTETAKQITFSNCAAAGAAALYNSAMYMTQILTGYYTASYLYSIHNYPTFIPTGNMTGIYGEYIKTHLNGAFTITSLCGLFVDAPTKTAGTVTNAYGSYFTAPTIGTTNTALYTDNLSVGYSNVTPPSSNGSIFKGNVGIGQNSATYQLDVTGTSRFNHLAISTNYLSPAGTDFESGDLVINNTLTSMSSCNWLYGIYNGPTFTMAANLPAGTANIYVKPQLTGAFTAQFMYGIRIDPMSKGTSTVTYAYGAYIYNPGSIGATSNTALYTADLSVGYSNVSPPTNGAIFSGSVGIGRNSASYALDITGTMRLGTLTGILKAATGVISAAAAGTDYEGVISAGTTAQYWRGDKSWQTLNQAAVAGLTTASSPAFTGLSLSGLSAGATDTKLLTADGSGVVHYQIPARAMSTGTVSASGWACGANSKAATGSWTTTGNNTYSCNVAASDFTYVMTATERTTYSTVIIRAQLKLSALDVIVLQIGDNAGGFCNSAYYCNTWTQNYSGTFTAGSENATNRWLLSVSNIGYPTTANEFVTIEIVMHHFQNTNANRQYWSRCQYIDSGYLYYDFTCQGNMKSYTSSLDRIRFYALTNTTTIATNSRVNVSFEDPL